MAVNIQQYSLKIIKEKGGRYELNKVIKSPYSAFRIFVESLELDKKAEENFAMLSLDIKNKITGVFIVSIGNISSSLVTPREVFKRAILHNASAIILGHNHPSGIPDPSPDDIKITKKLIDSGNLIGIEVLDHIIIGNKDSYISMKEKSYI